MRIRKPFFVVFAVTYCYGSARLAVDLGNWMSAAGWLTHEWKLYAVAALGLVAYAAPLFVFRDDPRKS